MGGELSNAPTPHPDISNTTPEGPSMLHTRFTEQLNLDYPVMNAPHEQPQRRPVGRGGVPRRRSRHLRRHQRPRAPNGSGSRSPTSGAPPTGPSASGSSPSSSRTMPPTSRSPSMSGVPVFIFSFADPHPWVGRAKDTGAVTICQVQSLDLARQAVDAGTDILMAQGNEAGGHTGEDQPPAPAGRSRRALPRHPRGRRRRQSPAAAPWLAPSPPVPTALPSAPPSSPPLRPSRWPDTFKEQVVQSDGQDTIFTRLYDLLGTRPWPDRIAGRVYRNRLVREWDGRDAEILANREELASDVAACPRPGRYRAFGGLHGPGRGPHQCYPPCRRGPCGTSVTVPSPSCVV